MTNDAHLYELQSAFNFSNDDLIASRNGQVTPHQEALVANRASQVWSVFLVSYSIIGGACSLFAFLAISEDTSPFMIEVGSRPTYAVVSIVLAGIIVITLPIPAFPFPKSRLR